MLSVVVGGRVVPAGGRVGYCLLMRATGSSLNSSPMPWA